MQVGNQMMAHHYIYIYITIISASGEINHHKHHLPFYHFISSCTELRAYFIIITAFYIEILQHNACCESNYPWFSDLQIVYIQCFCRDLRQTSDTYVKVYLMPDKDSKKTQIIKESSHPIFNESYVFPPIIFNVNKTGIIPYTL